MRLPRNPLVYQDGIRAILAGPLHAPQISISAMGAPPERALILDEATARELASALTWLLGELALRRGHASFRAEPPPRQRRRSVRWPFSPKQEVP